MTRNTQFGDWLFVGGFFALLALGSWVLYDRSKQLAANVRQWGR